jgi:hypothetical protein
VSGRNFYWLEARMRRWMLVPALVLVGAAMVRMPSQVANETVPSAVATANPCNGDAVALAGDSHIVITTTQATNGNYRAYLDISSRYTGVGVPSGLQYEGTDITHDEFLVANPLPFEETILQEFHLRSQTGADNYTMRLQYHVTVNSQGLLTAEVLNPTTTCTG